MDRRAADRRSGFVRRRQQAVLTLHRSSPATRAHVRQTAYVVKTLRNRPALLDRVRALAAAVHLPISADLQATPALPADRL
ncbi:MAG: hypothetical protein DVS81_13390 [Candidatus Accumulibacter meliphilus]|uniref:Uncharacterized protein n=1 Tax=Candidatus Accumulibacter meliphilus TaxID=2211374 RepID=A0A369XJH2_9PROT|nr:MAG: hypothetical protein DVS81_13390 [Candidatus Accumulibacter meliphilus]